MFHPTMVVLTDSARTIMDSTILHYHERNRQYNPDPSSSFRVVSIHEIDGTECAWVQDRKGRIGYFPVSWLTFAND